MVMLIIVRRRARGNRGGDAAARRPRGRRADRGGGRAAAAARRRRRRGYPEGAHRGRGHRRHRVPERGGVCDALAIAPTRLRFPPRQKRLRRQHIFMGLQKMFIGQLKEDAIKC